MMNMTSSVAQSRFAAQEYDDSRPVASSHAFQDDLDELLLGPNDLEEAMPFEFRCDYASAFDDKLLGGSGASSSQLDNKGTKRPTISNGAASRGHKRKSEAIASQSIGDDSAPPSNAAKKASPSSASSTPSSSSSTHIGRWTKKEHELFLEGLKLYGKSWKKISSLVVTRTLVQIRTHAQKYLQKQSKSALKNASDKPASSSSKAQSLAALTRMDVDDEGEDSEATQGASAAAGTSIFRPIAFPESCRHSTTVSSSISSSSASMPSFFLHNQPHRTHATQFHTSMSTLDHLLQDDGPSHHHQHFQNPHHGGEGYHSSPTSTDDDLAQWLHHRHLPLNIVNSPTIKKRRLDGTWSVVNPMEALSSTSNHDSAFSCSGSAGAHSRNYQQQTHQFLEADFLPPLSSLGTSPHFDHGWL